MILIISFLACGPVYSDDIVWSDEFDTVSPVLDGNRPNPATWAYDCGGGGFGNGQLEYNTARIENSYIENGSLVLEARREFYKEATANEFTSARMLTEGRFAFKYGTLEARIKLPDTADGLWPAFWMMGINYSGIDWPVCGETDILEAGSRAGIDEGLQNKKINAAVHYDNEGTYEMADQWLDAAVDLSLDYHLYKFEWTPTEMKWYLDGVQFWSLDITPDYLREFHQPRFVLINIAIGGWGYVSITDPGGITAPFPAKMYVDWIRLYSNPSTEIYLGSESEENGNFGIFTETTPVDNSLVYGDDTDPEWNYGTEAALYPWNNMTEATPPTPSEGSECWSFDINPGTWYGMGVFLPNYRNMKNYSDGYLHFDMATTTTDPIKIGIKSSVGDEFWVLLEDGVEDFGLVRDGEWHEVIIPLNRFANIDFQTVHQMFMIAGDPTMATNISLDDIWWEPSVPRQIPEQGNFGVYTETAANKTAGEFVLDTDGHFFIWENTLEDEPQTPYEGSESISLSASGGWFGCAFTPTIKYNLTAFRYPESRLHFALKTSSSTTFWLGMKSGNVNGMGQKWITFEDGSDPYEFVRDGGWHEIDIPMSDFTTDVDLFEVSQFFEILGTMGGISDIEFDDICFTGGGTPLVPSGEIPPSVSITSPVSGTFFDPGDNVTIEADANDADGTVTKVEFLEGVDLLGEDLTSPYSYTWNNVPEGAYTFRAKATDNNDVSRTSSPVTIYVGTPELTTIGVSPSMTSVEEGKLKQFTARGYDQFGQEFPADVSWSVSGGGVIDENGLFAAVDVGGPYTVTAVEVVEGILSDTASVEVYAAGLCSGPSGNGDYTWEATGASSNPTITFLPARPGVGDTLCIIYWSTSPGGTYPGYTTSPGTPFPVTASYGQTIWFYYTYSVPEGGEHSTFGSPHSFEVGMCDPIIASDFDGSGGVNFFDFAVLAKYWLETSCDVSNDYCEGADHGEDGDVDIYDLQVLVYSWLKGSFEVEGIPPTVSITSPVNGSAFDTGDNVTIEADANDADGTVTKVEFLEGLNLLGEDLTSPYSYTWNSVPVGAHVLTAKATDSNGLSSTSEPVTIYVDTPIPNLLANGGFELGTGADANDWGQNELGGATVDRVDHDQRTGDWCMYMESPTEGQLYLNNHDVAGGGNFTFEFYAKSTAPAVQNYRVDWFNGGFLGETGIIGIAGSLTGTYQKFSIDMTMPPATTHCRIYLWQIGDGSMYIDDVSLY